MRRIELPCLVMVLTGVLVVCAPWGFDHSAGRGGAAAGAIPWKDAGPDGGTSVKRGELAPGINDFGFELLRHASSSSSLNTTLSPFSVASGLALTAYGARGTTEAEMRHVLHADDMTRSMMQGEWAQLNTALAGRSPDQKLFVASAGWAREGLGLLSGFLKGARSAFGAEIATVDFRSQDFPTIVNDWVAAHTDGLIPKIIDEVDPLSILLLVNAVYFKGTWERPFRVGATIDRDFTLASGTTVKVPMMTRHGDSLQAFAADSFMMVRLPYKGYDSSMYLILPDQKVGLGELLKTMTGERFLAAARATANAPPRENALLWVPRLNLSWGGSMKKVLGGMGMQSAFDGSTADFRGIADQRPVWISEIVHRAVVKVGELGTEAAAAEGHLLGGSARIPEMISFNRPFLFAIVDEPSGVILFLSAVGDPRAN
jgi:serine protease inhibitor